MSELEGGLLKYDAARTALAAAHRVDEVKDIRDKAIAIQAYAKQANDTELIRHATEIRLRAERRGGELLIEMKRDGERQKAGDNPKGLNSNGPLPLPPKLSDLGVSKMQSHRWQKLAKMDEGAFESKVSNIVERAVETIDGVKSGVRGTTGTGENEWFTPVEYITRAREVLGRIDLDPATHPLAQTIIQAAQFFTKENDGLAHEWHGRVWLNPPYAQPLIAQFVSKLCAERKAGRITAAIMLTHNYTDTSWFQEATALADAVCFTRGRVKFCEPDGDIAAPTQGQAFFYFGEDVERFEAAFANIGIGLTPKWPVR